MKPADAVRTKKRQSTLDRTQEYYDRMSAEGRPRRTFFVPRDILSSLETFQSGWGLTRSTLVPRLISEYQAKDEPLSPEVAESMQGYKRDDNPSSVYFVSDEDWEYLKIISKKAGYRKNASIGLALIVREMDA